MRTNWPWAFEKLTLPFEGGYTTDKRDPGNWTGGKVGVGKLKGTKFGISAASYPNADIAGLTTAKAAAIYKPDFWDVVRGDELPSGVDGAVYDAGVMSGPARAARWLQSALGVAQDGKIGPATLKAASRSAGVKIIKSVCAKRLGFVTGLKIAVTYGRGWTKRVAKCEALCVTRAALTDDAATGRADAIAVAVTEREGAKTEAKVAGQSAAAGGATGGAIAGSGPVIDTHTPAAMPDVALWGLTAVGLLLVLGAVLYTWRWHVERQRAKAYEEVEKELRT